jgi:hypothetical protein
MPSLRETSTAETRMGIYASPEGQMSSAPFSASFRAAATTVSVMTRASCSGYGASGPWIGSIPNRRFRQAIDQPAHGDQLHPGADQRHGLAEEEQAEICRVQGAHEELQTFGFNGHEIRFGYFDPCFARLKGMAGRVAADRSAIGSYGARSEIFQPFAWRVYTSRSCKRSGCPFQNSMRSGTSR